MNVLLPTPGTPVMPTRWAAPAWGNSLSSIAWACSRWAGLRLSTNVMARATTVRFPVRTPST